MSWSWEVWMHRKYVKQFVQGELGRYAKVRVSLSRTGWSLNVYRQLGFKDLLVACLPLENDCIRRKSLLDALK